MLSQLNDYLIARSVKGGTTALIVDEAQLLSWELFEEIRLLTNLENSRNKLLQIVLVGQPELDQKLDSQELRQLKQRISLRARLEPLTLKEVQGYIRCRLELAGANSQGITLFPEDAIAAIYRFSRGIPRLVNTLCENSLIYAYSSQAKQITADVVREVATDLRLDVPTRSATSAPGNRDESKSALKLLLTQLLEELDRANTDSVSDTKFESYVKTE
jgi:type II secretory pathway predicted ATPase ExeA